MCRGSQSLCIALQKYRGGRLTDQHRLTSATRSVYTVLTRGMMGENEGDDVNGDECGEGR